MMTLKERLEKLGIVLPEIGLPAEDVALETWAVIACDQFSSERSYWKEVAKLVEGEASTFNLIIPECYLEEGELEDRVRAANAAMTRYLEEKKLQFLPPGFILVDRKTPYAVSRQGLVLAIDLEAYDFSENSQSLIRPTEGTIRKRLPARMAIRDKAVLDLPHILLLIDDPDKLVMKAAAGIDGRTVYDFELMQGGGRVKGSALPEKTLEPLVRAMENLMSQGPFLFAVGDGNHSLASAKEIWREKKLAGAATHDPSRYALVEVENIHEEALHFHPIHRLLLGLDAEKISADLKVLLNARITAAPSGGIDENSLGENKGKGEGSVAVFYPNGREELWCFPVAKELLVAEVLQEILDAYLAQNTSVGIDYIHGKKSLKELSSSAGCLGFLLPPVDKKNFFERIAKKGPYPRKTFSIGEAIEKRYYLETRHL